MSRESLVFTIGIIAFLTPFLGVPTNIKENIFIVLGIILMLVGYSLRRAAYLRSISSQSGERRTDAFVEHIGTRPDDIGAENKEQALRE
jgi:hypothetical protein